MKQKITKAQRQRYNEYVDEENKKTSYANGAAAGMMIIFMILAFIFGLFFNSSIIAGICVLLAGVYAVSSFVNGLTQSDKFDDHQDHI